MFEGLISSEGSKTVIREQYFQFKVLGYESIFSKVETNFASLSVGDKPSEIMYTILNQTAITNLLTVSAGNITCSVDQTTDAIADLENTSVKEALDILLEMGNSILYIDDNTVYVKARTPTAAVQYTFYGQASTTGVENIQNMTGITEGLNRTFNFWTWEDTTLESSDATSITANGLRKKEIGSTLFTNNTKRQAILDNLKTEFATKKMELKLSTPMKYDNTGLFILDRVEIDYPTVFTVPSGGAFAIYGVAIYGTSRYPIGQWSFTIDTTTNFKILGRTIDLKNFLITYDLREI